MRKESMMSWCESDVLFLKSQYILKSLYTLSTFTAINTGLNKPEKINSTSFVYTLATFSINVTY